MRFYRGNEYGYEISQKNGSWYHRVTWLHVVSPVLENDNEEERSTWNRGKPAFDKLDSIKQHFFHFLLSSALNYDVDSSFSSWLPSSRVGWFLSSSRNKNIKKNSLTFHTLWSVLFPSGHLRPSEMFDSLCGLQVLAR